MVRCSSSSVYQRAFFDPDDRRRRTTGGFRFPGTPLVCVKSPCTPHAPWRSVWYIYRQCLRRARCNPPSCLAFTKSKYFLEARQVPVAKIPVSVFLRVESKGDQILGVTLCSWRVSKTASKGPPRKSAFCTHQVPPLNQKKTEEMVRSASVSSGGGVARSLGRSVAGLVAR